MTAKEKAKELVDKMFNSGSALYADRTKAKECALIAVEEIIKIVDSIDPISGHWWKNEEGNYAISNWHLDFWNEVKSEIEKL